ncbi:MAG: hypothetical protein KGL39_42630 [Patescibacteria group bacterium]|nr:hypothetical protein [Patescibacteria group bacterium]
MVFSLFMILYLVALPFLKDGPYDTYWNTMCLVFMGVWCLVLDDKIKSAYAIWKKGKD